MSTRGCIARLTSKPGKKITFKGVFHHWDSYPEGLGSTLFKLRNGHFKSDTNAMLHTLIDEHPAGWSTINGVDFNLPAGYSDAPYKPNMNAEEQEAYELYKRTPHCFCHGERHEEAQAITQKNASGCGVEYVYAFTSDGKTMLVLSSYCGDDFEGNPKMIGMFGMGDKNATWKIIGSIDLNGLEPTVEGWDKIPIEQVTSEALKEKVAKEIVKKATKAEKAKLKQEQEEKKAKQKQAEDEALQKSPLAELLG